MALNIDSMIKRGLDIQSAVRTERPYAPSSSLDEMQLTLYTVRKFSLLRVNGPLQCGCIGQHSSCFNVQIK